MAEPPIALSSLSPVIVSNIPPIPITTNVNHNISISSTGATNNSVLSPPAATRLPPARACCGNHPLPAVALNRPTSDFDTDNIEAQRPSAHNRLEAMRRRNELCIFIVSSLVLICTFGMDIYNTTQQARQST